MKRITSLILEHRKRLKMTRAHLGNEIDRTPQYIQALESSGDKKLPSIKTLRQLVKLLARVDDRSRELDPNILLEFSTAVLGIKELGSFIGTLSIPQGELTIQESTAETWVISDVLAEEVEKTWAQHTARNILTRRAEYIFLVPHDTDGWLRACQNIERNLREELNRKRKDGNSDDETEKQLQDLLLTRLSVLGVPCSFFPARIRISNPSSAFPTGTYSIGGSASENETRFVNAPSDLVKKTIICVREVIRESRNTNANEPINNTQYGTIFKRFPDSDRLPSQITRAT